MSGDMGLPRAHLSSADAPMPPHWRELSRGKRRQGGQRSVVKNYVSEMANNLWDTKYPEFGELEPREEESEREQHERGELARAEQRARAPLAPRARAPQLVRVGHSFTRIRMKSA